VTFGHSKAVRDEPRLLEGLQHSTRVGSPRSPLCPPQQREKPSSTPVGFDGSDQLRAHAPQSPDDALPASRRNGFFAVALRRARVAVERPEHAIASFS
jgi:hypothetical protein